MVADVVVLVLEVLVAPVVAPALAVGDVPATDEAVVGGPGREDGREAGRGPEPDGADTGLMMDRGACLAGLVGSGVER